MKSIKELSDGILKHDPVILAQAITLIESRSETHLMHALELITRLLKYTGNSIRIAVTGVPGAGKSSLIEKLGLYLLKQKHRIAVLAIDPSSTISGGSILGDKTRMESLARAKDAFIRPSPSTGALGGVGNKTREAILLCEAAGYDIILIETLGVGQAELEVHSMVDFFLLVQIAGGGDELQGIKKGIVEIADAIVVNKADGENELAAKQAKEELQRALKYLMPAENDLRTPVLTCSAINNIGIYEIWETISSRINNIKTSKLFEKNRSSQKKDWFRKLLKDQLTDIFLKQDDIAERMKKLEDEILTDKLLPINAAEIALNLIKRKYNLK